MARTIDAEKPEELMCRQCNIELWEEPCEPDDCFIRNVILDRPTVDAVPVVRCKDCKFIHDKGYCTLVTGMTRIKPDDFCSRGERRNHEAD